MSYATTGTGCSLSGTSLTATDATTCVVTATKAASTGYLVATSASTSFTFKTCATGGACVVGNIGPGGGKVFYVSTTGFNEAGAACSPSCHYLEAAPTTGTNAWTDTLYKWSLPPTTTVGSTGAAIGTGLANTQAMAGKTSTAYSVSFVLAYRGPSNLSDWFLPSKDELNQLYLAKGTVGGVVADRYWSSGELDFSLAWYQDFANGNQASNSKVGTFYFRPVRAF